MSRKPGGFGYLVTNNGHAAEDEILAALANAWNSLNLASVYSTQEDVAKRRREIHLSEKSRPSLFSTHHGPRLILQNITRFLLRESILMTQLLVCHEKEIDYPALIRLE
jgi:hypothetical protein